MIQEITEAINFLISFEKDLESKLDLLTAIGATTTKEEVFKCCEEIRNEIVI